MSGRVKNTLGLHGVRPVPVVITAASSCFFITIIIPCLLLLYLPFSSFNTLSRFLRHAPTAVVDDARDACRVRQLVCFKLLTRSTAQRHLEHADTLALHILHTLHDEPRKCVLELVRDPDKVVDVRGGVRDDDHGRRRSVEGRFSGEPAFIVYIP